MPIYTYKAKKGPTEIVHGDIEAASRDEAVSRIEQLGLVPVQVAEKVFQGTGYRDQGTGDKPVKQTAKQPLNRQTGEPANRIRIKTRDIDNFTRQLSSLVRASVPVLRALSLVSQQAENRALRSLVMDLEQQIREGKVLSEAMQSYPKTFNNLYLNIVKSGEKSGMLDEALIRLTEHREKEQDMRHKVQAAMVYPIFLIVVGAGTIFIMLTYFLPKLMVLFENMRQELPLPTRFLIGLSDFMSANWVWFLVVIAFFAVMLGRIKAGGKRKFLFDSLKLRIPFLKKFVKNVEVVKFARTLELLLKNGIPVYESMELATGTLDNDALKAALKQVNNNIIAHGYTLSRSLKKTDIFPAFALNMITVGEEGGRLEGALSEIGSSYEKELEQTIKMMSSLLEPMLILVVGVVVGFIVMAMLLPIFDMGVMGT